jgi:hypothetical protein
MVRLCTYWADKLAALECFKVMFQMMADRDFELLKFSQPEDWLKFRSFKNTFWLNFMLFSYNTTQEQQQQQ